MKQIRLNEMDKTRKIEHVGPKLKTGLKKAGLLMYILPVIVVVGWGIYLSVIEYEDVQFILMIPVLVISIFMIITGSRAFFAKDVERVLKKIQENI